MPQRIFISGGFGYVGGRIANHLAHLGHEILIGTRGNCGIPYWLPYSEVVKINWDDSIALEKICHNVDVVIHAAGVNAQDCTNNPSAALAFNGLATERLVGAASKVGVKRFIYLSTAHVYANHLEGLITEKTQTLNTHPYATSHRAGELAVLYASQRGKIDGIVLRLSNAVGYPMHPDVNCWMLLVNNLCIQAIKTQKLTLRTNKMQQRDFISMRNICEVLEHIACSNNLTKNIGIVNVASGLSLKLIEIAKIVQLSCFEILNFEPEIEYLEKKNKLNYELLIDIKKIKKIYKNLKIYNLQKDIDDTLVFVQKNYKRIKNY